MAPGLGQARGPEGIGEWQKLPSERSAVTVAALVLSLHLALYRRADSSVITRIFAGGQAPFFFGPFAETDGSRNLGETVHPRDLLNYGDSQDHTGW